MALFPPQFHHTNQCWKELKLWLFCEVFFRFDVATCQYQPAQLSTAQQAQGNQGMPTVILKMKKRVSVFLAQGGSVCRSAKPPCPGFAFSTASSPISWGSRANKPGSVTGLRNFSAHRFRPAAMKQENCV